MNYEINYSATLLGEDGGVHENEKKRKHNAASLFKPNCIELMKENQSLQLAQVFSVIEEMSYYDLLIVLIWL